MKSILQFAVIFTSLFFGKILGQNPGTLDTSFNTGLGPDNRIYKMAVQPDGKILISGSYNNFNGNGNVERIARLNSDGSMDNTFNPVIGSSGNYQDNAFELQSDGKIIIYHTTLDLVRLNSDGSSDPTFNGGYFNNAIHDFAMQTDGKILVGGRFTKYNNITVPNLIARLNADGSIDNSFATTGTGFFGTATGVGIDVIAVQSDGKIVVGGNFDTYNGQPQSFLARLNSDGSLDSSFNVTTQISGLLIDDLAIQPDGKIVAVGTFTYTSNGQSKKNLIRLNTDGTLDTTFLAGTFSDIYLIYGIATLALQSDGKIVVGGPFSVYNGQPQKGIGRVNSDGSLDTTFTVGTSFSDLTIFQAPEVHSLALQSDGKILVGGGFKSYNGQSIIRIARLHSGGAPAAPSNLTAAPYNSILLNWQDNANNEDGFYVESATNINGPWNLITTTNPNATSYIHSGLTNGVEYFYRVSAFNSYGTSVFSNTASAVENSLSVSETNLQNLTIYPNPANDFVKISSIEKGSKISIYDMSGKIIYSEKSQRPEITINTQYFLNGTYILTVENEGKSFSFSKKLLVQHQ